MKQQCLEVKNITFAYKKKKPVLKAVGLTFEAGKITALLGNNGSGKTTLLRIIAGITRQCSGSLIHNGMEITPQNLLDYKRTVAYMPELLQLYPNMTAYNALKFLADLRCCPENAVMDTIEKVGLEDHYKKRVRSLSKGLKQRLNLAQAIIANPKIIIFDEPANGFDCLGTRNFYDIIKELAAKGAVVIFTTHLLSEMSSNVDNIAIMKAGQIIKFGTVFEFEGQKGSYRSGVVLYLDRDMTQEHLSALGVERVKCLRPNILSVDIAPDRLDDFIVNLKQRDFNIKNISFKKNIFEQNLESYLL